MAGDSPANGLELLRPEISMFLDGWQLVETESNPEKIDRHGSEDERTDNVKCAPPSCLRISRTWPDSHLPHSERQPSPTRQNHPPGYVRADFHAIRSSLLAGRVYALPFSTAFLGAPGLPLFPYKNNDASWIPGHSKYGFARAYMETRRQRIERAMIRRLVWGRPRSFGS